MSEGFIGEIRMFSGNYAPQGWALCQGQLLSISDNAALYSIVGTTYGGDGQSTFALPNLSGRLPMHPGKGPGLTERRLGMMFGEATKAITSVNLPAHTHTMQALKTEATEQSPSDENLPAQALALSGPAPARAKNLYKSTTSAGQIINSNMVEEAGEASSIPLDNHQPYLACNFIICTLGLYPARS